MQAGISDWLVLNIFILNPIVSNEMEMTNYMPIASLATIAKIFEKYVYENV